MTLARERQDLLDEGVRIPFVVKPSQGQNEFVLLDEWCKVLGIDDDEGLVWTEQGVFYSIDLDYKELA